KLGEDADRVGAGGAQEVAEADGARRRGRDRRDEMGHECGLLRCGPELRPPPARRGGSACAELPCHNKTEGPAGVAWTASAAWSARYPRRRSVVFGDA